MFQRSRLLLPLILCSLATPACAQEPASAKLVEVDSLLWTNPTPAPPYPYRDRLDARRRTVAEAIAEAYTVDSTSIIHPVEPQPSLYVEDAHGHEYRGIEARDYWAEHLPEGFSAVVEFDVAWNGQIREAHLRYYKGSLAGVDLREVVQRVRAEPDTMYGFPAPEEAKMMWLLRGR